MTSYAQRALLPAGLRDVLPRDAAFEAQVTESLVDFFAVNGYDRITPPLIEFEETLLFGGGAATAAQVFRFMDPVSRRMMGVRADMTPQVARIAVTRLANAPRPLRLGYAGQVLRVKGTQLRPERQTIQAGVELIGSASPEADVEVILLIAEALTGLGVHGVSVDINLPTLVPAVLADFGVGQETAEWLQRAIAYKDSTAITALDSNAANLLSALVAICGPADHAINALDSLDLLPMANSERNVISRVVKLIRARAPNLTVTIDPVEHRGFEYHTGVSFAIFARSVQGELGRGGRYIVEGDTLAPNSREPAVGATLCVDAVLEALSQDDGHYPQQEQANRRLLLPINTPRATMRLMQAAGWVTIIAIDPAVEIIAEAKRLGCSYILVEGNPIFLISEGESDPLSVAYD